MSILNPYVLLGILVAMLSAYGGGYYKAPSCPTLPTASDAPVAERSDPPTAELQPEVARDILAITDEADLTARKLNACIATYETVRKLLNQNER